MQRLEGRLTKQGIGVCDDQPQAVPGVSFEVHLSLQGGPWHCHGDPLHHGAGYARISRTQERPCVLGALQDAVPAVKACWPSCCRASQLMLTTRTSVAAQCTPPPTPWTPKCCWWRPVRRATSPPGELAADCMRSLLPICLCSPTPCSRRLARHHATHAPALSPPTHAQGPGHPHAADQLQGQRVARQRPEPAGARLPGGGPALQGRAARLGLAQGAAWPAASNAGRCRARQQRLRAREATAAPETP